MLSEAGAAFRVRAIAGFRLAAPEPAAAAAFLREATDAEPIAAGSSLRLELGGTPLELAPGPARPPPPADDPAFQHLALVVSDIAAAHARVTALGATPLTRGGPVQLPPASGGVTAWKFLTPWNQPLELLQTPNPAWRARAQGAASPFLGVDHTALGCDDAPAALKSLGALGFVEGPPSHNIGPEQDVLDGLDGVDLHIRTLFTPGAGPHIELLDYAAPRAQRSRVGSSAVTILITGDGGPASTPVCLEGHRLVRES